MKTDGARSPWLALGGTASFLAAALHLACIAGGPSWYLALGAGQRMATMVERGEGHPTAVTVFIAGVLSLWGLYAWSGAGLIRRLPLLRTALCAITTIYLVRAVAFAPLQARFPGNSATFWWVSSSICLAIGALHALGLWLNWSRLSPPTARGY